MWFKVVLNADGTIDSCVQVASAETNGRSIRFIEAESEAGAVSLAKAWWREVERQRARNKQTYDTTRALGICVRCHKSRAVSGKKMCEACLEAQRNYARDRASGEREPQPKKTNQERVEIFEERRERSQEKYQENYGSSYEHAQKVARRDTLAEVQKNFDYMSVSAFRAWLSEALNKAIAERPPARKAAWRTLVDEEPTQDELQAELEEAGLISESRKVRVAS